MDMSCLLDAIVTHVPPPRVLGGPDEEFKMLVTQIERDPFVGKLALGRVSSGRVQIGSPIHVRAARPPVRARARGTGTSPTCASRCWIARVRCSKRGK